MSFIDYGVEIAFGNYLELYKNSTNLLSILGSLQSERFNDTQQLKVLLETFLMIFDKSDEYRLKVVKEMFNVMKLDEDKEKFIENLYNMIIKNGARTDDILMMMRLEQALDIRVNQNDYPLMIKLLNDRYARNTKSFTCQFV